MGRRSRPPKSVREGKAPPHQNRSSGSDAEKSRELNRLRYENARLRRELDKYRH